MYRKTYGTYKYVEEHQKETLRSQLHTYEYGNYKWNTFEGEIFATKAVEKLGGHRHEGTKVRLRLRQSHLLRA